MAATDSDITSPNLPTRYIDFIGCINKSPITDEPALDASQLAEPRHPNQAADGGWVESKGDM